LNRSDEFEEVREIAEAVCNEEVSPEQVQKLEILLNGNEAAQRFYYEYIGMHVHMKASVEPSMEIVRRRLQLEEVIVRPVGSTSEFPTSLSTHTPLQLNDSRSKQKNPIFWIPLAACIVLTVALFYTFNREPVNYLAEIVKGRISSTEIGQVKSSTLIAGDYTTEKQTLIKLQTGNELEFQKQSDFKLLTNSEIELKKGALKINKALGDNLKIIGPNFKINSEGSNLAINLMDEKTEISSGEETILIPKRWRPKHYWSFDSQSDRAIDQTGHAHGVPEKGAHRVEGLLGSGAFYFDNSADAQLNVGSGGGTAPATGSFAVTDGVTIEALIKPEWSGAPGELDEIFRKDQTDNNLRMLLCFQNDKGKQYLMPKGDVDESLGFGLYLVGQGYHELKLPLDGKNGRPTLAQLKDGKAHHVVATYNVITGLKAMYIDGVMHASYQYPSGSKMLSGGSGMTTIGNSPNTPHLDKEAFAGTIDEVAFYDFALPDYMILQHYHFFQKGLNYFGLQASPNDLPHELQILLPKNKTVVLDTLTGLPSSIKK
jgi:hypothetical protein